MNLFAHLWLHPPPMAREWVIKRKEEGTHAKIALKFSLSPRFTVPEIELLIWSETRGEYCGLSEAWRTDAGWQV